MKKQITVISCAVILAVVLTGCGMRSKQDNSTPIDQTVDNQKTKETVQAADDLLAMITDIDKVQVNQTDVADTDLQIP